MTKPSVGVIGMGFVGTVIYKYYSHLGFNTKAFDVKSGYDSINDVSQQDVIFVAIMLPDNGMTVRDRNALVQALSPIRAGRTVIIKSTIVPGTTNAVQTEYPDKYVCFVPEFLTESTAERDFSNPPFQILGVTRVSNNPKVIDNVLNILPTSRVTRVMAATEAEMLKLVRNSYWALKLIVFNQVYDICGRAGVNYGVLKDVLTHDTWIGDSHNVIWHKGKRGFDGKCLPKDIQSLISYCKLLGAPAHVFELAQALNHQYLTQNMCTGTPDKTEHKT